jgi:hypothetical protein
MPSQGSPWPPTVIEVHRRPALEATHAVPSAHPSPTPVPHGSPASPAGEHVPHAGTVGGPPSGVVPNARAHRVLEHCASSEHRAPSGRVPGATMQAGGRTVASHGVACPAAAHASSEDAVQLVPGKPRRATQLCS